MTFTFSKYAMAEQFKLKNKIKIFLNLLQI